MEAKPIMLQIRAKRSGEQKSLSRVPRWDKQVS
jgi:hypothetical protein